MQLEAGCGGKIISVYLSQLFEHRYLTTPCKMHIRLPDKHNVTNHFCLQAFLPEQSFLCLSMSFCFSAVNYFVVFHSRF